MLTLKQNNYSTGIKFLGEFNNISEIFEYVKNRCPYEYKFTRFHEMFSYDFKDYYNTSFYNAYNILQKIPCYIIENEKGIRYSRDTVKGFIPKIKHRTWFYGFKWHPRGSYHRHPQTQYERKFAVNVYEDEPKIRAKRNIRNLPNSWDDINHADLDYRNWKHYRKHQWK